MVSKGKKHKRFVLEVNVYLSGSSKSQDSAEEMAEKVVREALDSFGLSYDDVQATCLMELKDKTWELDSVRKRQEQRRSSRRRS